MFNIGDVVVYSSQGICKIDCIEQKQIGKQKMDYYVLKPLFNDSTSVFVPVDNETLTAKIQNVLTKQKAKELVEKATDIDVVEIKDENKKRELYKAILSSNDREQLIALIKTIRLERDVRRGNNKKLNINDEQTLRKAELLLYNELAFAFGVEPDDVKNIIKF